MDLGLSGLRAIVTGGSRGIGRATIDTLVAEGAHVATCARGGEALQAALAEWRGQGATVFGEALDVTDQQAFEEWISGAQEQLGGVDILVSNVTTRIETTGAQRWQETFDVDLLQHIRVTDALLPALKNSHAAAIVYVASIASIMNTNMPGETEYGAMKAALISYAAQLATRLGKYGIRVNTVSPGPVYHEGGFWQMIEREHPDMFSYVASLSVLNRHGTAAEVANAITFLASPAAGNITAANLRVDGATIKTVNY